ncbi:MAG: hypothetical protein Q9M39_10200 [Sulfurovum sp.]|nr:hypothetical protein [Sulfurovum sp.]
MLSLQIDNPMVENYLSARFKDDTEKMTIFINDFIEKELIKKDITIAFGELDEMLNSNKKANTLESLIEEIRPR